MPVIDGFALLCVGADAGGSVEVVGESGSVKHVSANVDPDAER